MPFCTACGAKYEEGARFCMSCGAKVVAAAAAPPPQQQQQQPLPAASQPPPQATPAQAAASVCGGCGRPIGGEDAFAVGALGRRWHKDCFKCARCGQRIFSFSRFYEADGGGRPLCARCHAAAVPRCALCAKPVDGEYVEALGKAFHPQCMVCAGCGRPFGPDGFFEDNGKLWHLQCQQ